MQKATLAGIAAFVFLLLTATAQAQVTLPYTFNTGQAARATEVNGNFQALAAALNNVVTRLDRLEGGTLTNATVAGTYRIMALQTGLFAGASPGLVEAITYSGTLTLTAAGTYNGTLNGARHDLFLHGGANATLTTDTTTDMLSGTYTVNQTKVTLSDLTDFYGAAGGRILVGSGSSEDPPPGQTAPMGANVVLILVRTN